MADGLLPPPADSYGGTYHTAHKVAEALGIPERQFYELLHAAILRTDEQVDDWDRREAGDG